MKKLIIGGIDYTKNLWAFHYRLGYQSFTDSINGNNINSPERSTNIDDPRYSKGTREGHLLFRLPQTEHPGERILLHR